jgi:hypothetical protein
VSIDFRRWLDLLWHWLVLLPRRLLHALIHLIVVTCIVLAFTPWLDGAKDSVMRSRFMEAQANSYAAVASINPSQILRRYICAITPSVELQNTRLHVTVWRGIRLDPRIPVSDDCAITLAKTEPKPKLSSREPIQKSAQSESPAPVVGHWSDGMNGLIALILGFADVAWHYIYQRSILASILSLTIFAFGGAAGFYFLAVVRFPPHPLVLPAMIGIASIVGACIFAWLMQEFMDIGGQFFSWVSQLVVIKFGVSFDIAAGTATFFWKTIDTFIHSIVDKIVPHLK